MFRLSAMADCRDLLIPFDRLVRGRRRQSGKVTRDSAAGKRGGESIGFSQQGGSVLALDVGARIRGKILMASEAVPEMTTGTRLANDDEGLGVETLVDNPQRRTPQPRRKARSGGANAFWSADDAGRVRIKVRARFDGRAG